MAESEDTYEKKMTGESSVDAGYKISYTVSVVTGNKQC